MGGGNSDSYVLHKMNYSNFTFLLYVYVFLLVFLVKLVSLCQPRESFAFAQRLSKERILTFEFPRRQQLT